MYEIVFAVSYLRYSPGPDQDENSIIGQRADIIEFANREGYTLVGEYVDRAMSAVSDKNRKDFLRVIADSEKGLFSCIIV
jgi:DNA invertase Pin-like site-specific DNA recombinase